MKVLLERALFKLLKGLFALLPRRLGLAIGRLAGSAFFRLDGRHRRLALRNLATAFGTEKTPAERRAIARSSFRHFGAVTADVLKLFHLSSARTRALLEVEGEQHLTRALAAGRGALIVTGHLGNWEVAAAAMSRLGKLNVIARRLDNSALERELFGLRRRLGTTVIYKKEAARRVLEALRAGEIVAILIDQNVLRREGVFVDFFGRPASTTPGLAAFHLRSGAPVVPVFCRPTAAAAYRIVIHPPLDLPAAGPPEANVLKITQILTKIIETE
ncbi:MAG: lysophospholipid acyltransferase family protein, partial [Candidatus Aminicenantes bacterium]|nr:lysophospholipid acyltransferase family protein [Candidatus Aminicenantes bacterium]